MNLYNHPFHKTRIAPTPSGYLHAGNVLAFAITAALAKQTHAGLLLRIDDMDRLRAQPAYVQDIFDTLQYLDIPWQEGPANAVEFEQVFSQQHRLPLYQQALEQLQQANAIYACNCSRTQITTSNTGSVCPGNCRNKAIPLDTPQVNWRLKTNRVPQVTVKTFNGPLTANLPSEMQDFVVRKKDGLPAYQLTSLIDDVHFKIDLIVRGEDLWHSTLAQLNLATQLNLPAFNEATFYHHPLLLNAEKQKLSKSAGAISIQYLRNSGYTPAAICQLIGNMLTPPSPANSWKTLAKACLA